MFSKEKIVEYADKLLIGLSDEEINILLEEADVIKENMDLIDSIEGIKDVEPMSFAIEAYIDKLRNDKEVRLLETREALKNSQDAFEDVACVPKVVG